MRILENIKSVCILTIVLMFIGCSSIDVTKYASYKPIMQPEVFFDGQLTAHGVVKDRAGKVTRSLSEKTDCPSSIAFHQQYCVARILASCGTFQAALPKILYGTQFWTESDDKKGLLRPSVPDIHFETTSRGCASGRPSPIHWSHCPSLAIKTVENLGPL